MHITESIIGRRGGGAGENHSYFPGIWTWLEVWEDLDSFQSLKENTAYID